MSQEYAQNFEKENVPTFVQSLDEFLKMKGHLVTHTQAADTFASLISGEAITFEQFYTILCKWAVTQDKLGYEDFATNEEGEARQEEMEAFKKMTDRIL